MQTTHRVILAISLAIMMLCSWFAPLDSISVQQVDAGMKRALFSFATARALNAVISVAQGTEVSIQPLGFGVNFTPGQLLDPVNDLVEQFSNLMLVASVAFGVQKVLIVIGGNKVVSLALTAAALGWAWVYFRHRQPPVWITRVLIILVMLRFAVPIVTISADFIFQQFLAADYVSSQQAIDTASGQITRLNPTASMPHENQGLLEKTKGWWSQNVDVKMRFENFKQAAERATEHIIKLIVIFLLQTLIIPLLLLWGLYSVAKGAFGWVRLGRLR